MNNCIGVVIITPHDLNRKGLEALLHSSNGLIHVVGIHRTFETLLDNTITASAHVLLIDDEVAFPTTVFAAISDLNAALPAAHLVVLSSIKHPRYVQMLMDAGASGFIFREDDLEETLLIGIQTVVRGNLYASPIPAGLMIGIKREPSFAALTENDMNVLRLIDEGTSLKTIASHLKLSVRSVYRIRNKLCETLAAPTIQHLVAAAREQGIISGRRTHR